VNLIGDFDGDNVCHVCCQLFDLLHVQYLLVVDNCVVVVIVVVNWWHYVFDIRPFTSCCFL